MIILYAIFYILSMSNVNAMNLSCYDNICYTTSSVKSNYTKASDECKKLNLTLAYVANETAQLFLKKYTISRTETFYIGLKYIHDQRFIWDCDSDQIPHLNWNKDQKSFTQQESCVYLKDGKMNLGHCNESRSYLCSNNTGSTELVGTGSLRGVCPSGFFRMLNKCYKLNLKCNDATKTWKDAQDTCKSHAPNSSLMIVDSMIEQEFLTALITKSNQPVWIGLVHTNLTQPLSIWIDEYRNRMPRYPINFKNNEPNNVHNEKCLMVYHRLANIGQMNDERCDKWMNYICESPLIEAKEKDQRPMANPLFFQGKCHQGYYEFNETCYKVNVNLTKYEEAQKSCEGKLLFVHDYIDTAFIRSLMASQAISEAWVSVVDNIQGSYDHSHGAYSLLNEIQGNSKVKLDEAKNYFMSSNIKGLYKANTGEKKSSICYYFLPGHEKNTDHLICPISWHKVGQKCYQSKQIFVPFEKAVENCKIYNAKLATLSSMKEVKAINFLIQSDSWIGINRSSYLNNSWIDGSQLDYCMFRHTKNMTKKAVENLKTCFIMRYKTMEWDGRECSEQNSYTCEKPAIENPCQNASYKYIDGDCYAIFNFSKTWNEAENYCQQIGGSLSHLASFHSWEQESLTLSGLNDSISYWIGLRIYDNTMRWIDETPLNYQQVFKMFGFLHHSGMSCFSSRRFRKKDSDISWARENCGLRKPFVCKISSNKKVIIAPKKPKLGINYFCPKGFDKHGSGCYKLFNNETMWRDADTNCKTLFKKPNPIARLASFESIPQFESVLSSLKESDNILDRVWIGLHRQSIFKPLVWIDETPFDLMKTVANNDNPMSYESKVAMEVSSNPFKNGQWWMDPNIKHLPYICRVDPHEEDHKDDDNKNVKSYTEITSVNCPSQFVEYNGFCYFNSKFKLSFIKANNYCTHMGASLLIINDTFEEHFVRALLAKTTSSSNFVWMGLKVDPPNLVKNWTTTDKSALYYTHWVELASFKDMYTYSDVDPKHRTEGCYILQYNDSITIDNGMARFSCDVPLPFICKKRANNTIIPPPLTCANANNGTSYLLDVYHSKSGAPCVRWDLVNQKDPYYYHSKFQLQSAFPFNKEGYLSYALHRCSEFKNDSDTFHPYSCYILKDNKYILEDCVMVPCHSKYAQHTDMKNKARSSYHGFVVTISIFITLFVIGFVCYVYRRNMMSNYRIRSFLSSALGHYQPDWIRYPNGRPPTATVGGTGFVNPVYTPLESRY